MEEKQQNIIKKDSFKWAIIGVLALVIIILIFSAGIWIGDQKGKFTCHWAENYQRNFAGPKGGFIGDWKNFPAGDIIEGHGSFGKIIKIEKDSLVIDGSGLAEKIVLIKDNTIIKNFNGNIKLSDLKVDDFITVVGTPNDSGQIEAELIRVIPTPPTVSGENQSINNQPNNNQTN